MQASLGIGFVGTGRIELLLDYGWMTFVCGLFRLLSSTWKVTGFWIQIMDCLSHIERVYRIFSSLIHECLQTFQLE